MTRSLIVLTLIFAAAAPLQADIGDANGDGSVTAADIFYLINYLLAGGPAPK